MQLAQQWLKYSVMVLTGLGFLVGVGGFITFLVSSQGTRMLPLPLPFLVKSCPLTVRL